MLSDIMVALFDLFTPFAVQVGITCLVAQVVLYVAFATEMFGQGPWSKMPSFTAHQIICIPVLFYLSIQGLRELGQDSVETAVDRLTGPRHRHFAEFVIGMMFFWDIPTGLCTRALREVGMVLHHFGMFATAAIAMGALSDGKPVLGYYAPFFFGMVEISSLPLIVVDIFHPKHKAWNAYLTSNDRPWWVRTLNEVSRLMFAGLFLILRTICFPYISIMGVLADVIRVTSLPLAELNGVPKLPLYIMAFLNVLFSFLQLYWGSLIVRQIVKLVRGGGSATKAKTK